MNDAPPTAIKELRHWPQWVIWRIDARDGKTTKIPLCAHAPGQRASSTDPKTWAPYEATLKPIERGRADGAGFVFSETDEYTGIDLDHCVTDGIVHPAAMDIVQRLGSYTEFSPSGRGLHIIIRGAVHAKRNRTKKTPWGHDFEVYDRARFFTMTGRQLFGSPATIEARQEELDAICAEMFPVEENGSKNGHPLLVPVPTSLDDVALEEKIRSSKQGPRFAELFDRGAPEGQESEADLGLCNILAFWLGPDEARIDAWFRRSALLRDKWDDKRGETTYGGFTIARALEGRTEYYGQKKTAPAARPKDDNTKMSYEEEISSLFGIIDDPIVDGWRSSRKATARVVFTTRSGAELDLDSWKAATGSPAALAQEIGVQLGVEVTLKKEDIKRLNVLVGKFCKLKAAWTLRDRARELGLMFLQQAETLSIDLTNTAERWSAFKRMHDRDPVAYAKEQAIPLGAAYIVLLDVSGKRYVRIQWFVDYVKANAVAGTASTILDHIEEPGNWDRIQNAKSRMKATDPRTKEQVWQILYEVPRDWGDDESDPG